MNVKIHEGMANSSKKRKLNKSKKNNQEEVLSENDSMVLPNKSCYNKEKNNELYELEIEGKK